MTEKPVHEVKIGEEMDLDFDFDDELKQSLDSLMRIPLEFIDGSSDEDGDPDEVAGQEEEEPETVEEVEDESEEDKRNGKSKAIGDSVERQLEALFVDEREDPGGGSGKDNGLENISDNDFDGPESGECDTSDGELPDSPSVTVTVTLPELPQVVLESDGGESSDVELLEHYQNRSREHYENLAHRGVVSKPEREVIISQPKESDTLKGKEKKEKDPNKHKEKSGGKSREKKEKNKKRISINNEELKKKLKLKKYLARIDQYRAKCFEYLNHISKKCEMLPKDDKNKFVLQTTKIRNKVEDGTKLKSVVEKINPKERDVSPPSSTSSKFDQASHSSYASKVEKASRHGVTDGTMKRRSGSAEKEYKSKSDKKRSKSKELKEHKLKYQKYIQYLQSEREKCFEERTALDKHKSKSKRKRRKSESSSPEKSLLEKKEKRPPVLSFSEFCNSRELTSPEREVTKKTREILVKELAEQRKGRTISVDSTATTSSVQSENLDHTDDGKDLFVTYSDLVEQDKQKEQRKKLDNDQENIKNILDKDPELKSISVFTSVLFKGSTDSSGIPFLQESRPSSPKTEDVQPKSTTFTPSNVPDEIYDWNDDLSNISQSSLSPSRSPAPKLHNKALLNFLENQKERVVKRKVKTPKKSLKLSRSRSKSPKKMRSRSKKRKTKLLSSISVSPSPPPPLRPRSPEIFKKRPSPPAHLKDRWRDYPSPPERRREYYERPSRSRRRSRSRTRSRVSHRSRSSSEERERHYHRRYRSRSRSRSPPESPTVSPAMVQITAAEKRRRLKEEHERALDSLRATMCKPMSSTPLAITFTCDGDNYHSVRDNYDPVLMTEGSSSPSPSEVSKPPSRVDSLPPLPPGLPPELPPVPPSAPPLPAAPQGEDMTVVTTYTSFVPLPNSNLVPPHRPNDLVVPMGYVNTDMHQMPPFNNWMGPGIPMGDMGMQPNMQHHMFQPQMVNNYEQFNGPQQSFQFLNQPPPPLPYQMQMPPPCHQHYRMPNPGPPPSINLLSVRQEIKNIKSNPVIITQMPDSPDRDFSHSGLNSNTMHSLEPNKCKHNPLGENNQTVQEAIDSVKKCLKNCESVKNKDPRLGPVEVRIKSPEVIVIPEDNSQPEDRKVKITLNYKPRPVTASALDPETELEAPENEPNTRMKGNRFTEKNFNIEGIVSKLKGTIGTAGNSKNDDQEGCRGEVKIPGDEPYDPFADSEENPEDCVPRKETQIETELESALVKDESDIRQKLSDTEVKKISNQIDQSFGFILSHSIGRQRLTPSLPSINVKKAEIQNKHNFVCYTPVSKQCQMLRDKKKKKNRTINVDKGINFSTSVVNIQTVNQTKASSDIYKPPLVTKNVPPQQSLYKPRQIPQTDLSMFEHVIKASSNSKNVDSSKTNTTEDSPAGTLTCIEKEIITNSQGEKAETNITNPNLEKQNTNLRKKNSRMEQMLNVNKENSTVEAKFNSAIDGTTLINEISVENKLKLDQETTKTHHSSEKAIEDQICFEENSKKDCEKNKEISVDKKENEKEDDTVSCGLKESVQKSCFVNNKNEKEISISTPKTPQETEEVQTRSNKQFSPVGKKSSNTERRGHPLLSIPTKGELKRFPTPERTIPKSRSLNLETLSEKSKDPTEKCSDKTEITQLNPKVEVQNKIRKSCLPKNVVESILHDFEDSNSTGSDLQEVGKDNGQNKGKNQVNSNKTQNHLKVIEKEDVVLIKHDLGNIDDTEKSNEHKSAVGEDKTESNHSVEKRKKSHCEKGIDLPSTKLESRQKRTCKVELSIPCKSPGVDENGEKNKDNSSSEKCQDNTTEKVDKEEIQTINARKNKRRSKKSTYLSSDIPPNLTCELETECLKTDGQLTHKSLSSENCNNASSVHSSKISDSSNKVLDGGLKDELNMTLNEDSLPILSPFFKEPSFSDNLLLKPCPLSKKSQSYISQNLPISFDLSIDENLIRRGFKKLQVNVAKISVKSGSQEKPNSTEDNSHKDGSLSSGEIAKSSSCSAVEVSLNKTFKTVLSKQHLGLDKKCNNVQIQKRKPVKKVSFDLNVCEIIDKSKQFSENDQTLEVCNKKDFISNNCIETNKAGATENVEPVEMSISEIDLKVKSSKTIEVVAKDTSVLNDTNKDEVNESGSGHSDKEPDADHASATNISLFYKTVIDILNSYQTTPLIQLRDRKSLTITIPKAEDMPEAKVWDSPKRIVNMKNKKKTGVQEQVEDIISIEQPDEEITNKQERVQTLSHPKAKCSLENNNCRVSEQNDSDNDDSVILDRELSDLAKGCLDSDSTVGGDDDSVLNFGIAASDDSSLDSDLDSKSKSVPTRQLPRQKSKLSSPQNIKKRFSKKLKSLGVDVSLKITKNTDCQLSPIEKEKNPVKSLPSVKLLVETEKIDLSGGIPPDEVVSDTIKEKCEQNSFNPLPNTGPTVTKDLEPSSLAGVPKEGKTLQRKKRGRYSKRQINRHKCADQKNDFQKKDTKQAKELSYNKLNINQTSPDQVIHEGKNSTKDDLVEGFRNESEVQLDGLNLETKENEKSNSKKVQQLEHVEEEIQMHTDYSTEDLCELNVTTGNPPAEILQINEQFPARKSKKRTHIEKGDKGKVTETLATKRSRRGKCEKEISIDDKTVNGSINNVDSKLPDKELEPRNESKRSDGKDQNNTEKKKSKELRCENSSAVVQSNEGVGSDEILQSRRTRKTKSDKIILVSNVVSSDQNVDSEVISSEKDVEVIKKDKGKCFKSIMLSQNNEPVEQSEEILDKDFITITDNKEHTETCQVGKTRHRRKEEELLKQNDSVCKIVNHDLQAIEKEKVKKLEADSSTPSGTRTTPSSGSSRKTRSAKQNKGFKTENIEFYENFEFSVLKTKNKKNPCDIIEMGELKEEASNENEMIVKPSVKCDIEIKEDKTDVKEPLLSRKSSTESIDEPLILVKQKLLAEKLEEIKIQGEKEVNKEFEDTKEHTNSLQNENIQSKVKSCVSNSNNSPGQSNGQGNHQENKDESLKNGKNNTNDSNSNPNDFSNTESNSKSYLNPNNVSSSDLNDDAIMLDPPCPKSDDISMNKHSIEQLASHELCFSNLQNNSSINPKLKEALRKKRDKAEVDAEIKRRLAEIDELEKLARNQHANALEKIGARTRSRSLIENQNRSVDDDVVSISSEDSHGTCLEADPAVSFITAREVSKSEELTNEEPSTTQEDGEKIKQTVTLSEDSTINESNTNNLPKDVVLKKKDPTRRTRSKIKTNNDSEGVSKTEDDMAKKSSGVDVLISQNVLSCTNEADNLTCGVSIKHSSSVAEETGIILKNKQCDKKKTIVKPIIEQREFSRESSPLLTENIKRVRRNVISLYQFRENDDDVEPDDGVNKQINNRSSRNRNFSSKQKNKMQTLSLIEKDSPTVTTDDSSRRRRNKAFMPDTLQDKPMNTSRDASPSNQRQKEVSVERSPESPLDFESKRSDVKNTIPEPDSSTPALADTPLSPLMVTDKSVDVVEKSQADEQSSVESDSMDSSSKAVFRQPFRKSLVTRRKRRRRQFFGRCIPSSRRVLPVASKIRICNDSSEQDSAQSEEVVSSSVSTTDLPCTEIKKKRKRRKTVIDLLMEDSMLSVTRDFPMSPNPYILPNFYKELDPCVIEQNSKKHVHELPPKPDVLAQKLRLLEKLKGINRKNRKTRQCRTLVCYNEDSLPESLVESPVGETVGNTIDSSLLPQELISIQNNSNEKEQNSSSSFFEASEPKIGYCISTSDDNNDTSSDSRKRGQKANQSQVQPKRGRRIKVTEKLNIRNDDEEYVSKCVKENQADIKEAIIKNNNETISPLDKVSEKEELSAFDKLLENKPNDAITSMKTTTSRIQFDFNNLEDKSNDLSDDYFDSFPSPMQSDSDDTSENEQNVEVPRLGSEFPPMESSSNVLNLKQPDVILPLKIMCSILKSKIGKMLPYFGDSSSDEGDIDEDIPLSIKLAQSKERKKLSLRGKKNKPSNTEEKKMAFQESRPSTRRTMKLEEVNIKPYVAKQEKKLTRNSIAVVHDEVSILKSDEKPVNEFGPSNTLFHAKIESPPTLRKSTRRPKTFDVSYKDNYLQIDDLNLDQEPINEKVCEINKDVGNKKPNLDTSEKLTPVRRRGRPSKILKPDSQDIDFEEDIQKPISELISSLTKNNPTSQESDIHNLESRDSTPSNKRKGRKLKTQDNTSDEITSDVGCENIKKELRSSESSPFVKKNDDAARLELSDLNSTKEQSISVRRTRGKRIKQNSDFKKIGQDNKINDLQRNESEDDSDDGEKLNLPTIKSLSSKDSLTDRELVNKQRRGKAMNKSKNDSTDDHGGPGESSDVPNQDSNVNNKEETNSILSTTVNDSPPSLIKTRAMRPRLPISENIYLEPPNLETPFTSEVDFNGKEDFDNSVNTDSNIDKICPPLKKRGRKPKKIQEVIKENNDDENLQVFPLESQETLFEKDLKPTSTETDKNFSVPQEKQIQTRKRGRRGRRKVICKTTRKDSDLTTKERDSEYDSEVEINIPFVKSNESPCNENFELTATESGEVISKQVANLNEEQVDSSSTKESGCTKYSEEEEPFVQVHSRKRKRKQREIYEASELPSCDQETTGEQEEVLESDRNELKKMKTQEIKQTDKETRIQKPCGVPSSTNNKQGASTSTSSSSGLNPAFLWSKISGFLNKTTRSVGTQVKIKNMALKGFESSEPEVSLQSELTLPQVIKTLFEELKSLDSSFSDP